MTAAARPESVSSLYLEHHGWLQGWLRRRTGCSAEAADLAQDTFVRLLAAPKCVDQAGALREPRSFLATIARRVMIDHFRRRDLERAWLETLSHQSEPLAVSPEERALIIETLLRLDAMLDGLGAKVRSAFLLSQLDGLGYAEIATRLGVSASSVKKYVARATEQCLLFMLEDAA